MASPLFLWRPFSGTLQAMRQSPQKPGPAPWACLLLWACLAWPLPAHAAGPAPALALPVDCVPGDDCHVQNYFDHDPGPGWADFACGHLSYDGHTGTDFALPDLAAMRGGVAVLAATDGTVRAVRDGMADTGLAGMSEEDRRTRGGGNAVVLDHDNGWQTMYAHLRRGSVAVRQGQRVRAGDVLGLVGMSGRAEFPHVELSVRLNGRALDPFTGDDGPTASCGDTSGALWSAQALAALAYRPTGLLGAGFTSAVPDLDGLMQGRHHARSLSPTAPAVIFWVRLFGLRAGDEMRVRMTGPDGEVLAESAKPAPGDKAVYFLYAGKRRSAGLWPPGDYQGEFTLLRPQTHGPAMAILRASAGVTVR